MSLREPVLSFPLDLTSAREFRFEMLTKIFVFALFGLVFGAEEMKNSKRSIGALDIPSWNSILSHSWSSIAHPWSANAFSHGSLHSISPMYPGKASHLGLIPQHTTHDITAAVAAAKEATAAAALAQQRVQAAREHVVIQERVAAAKEAAAQAAIQRSEAAAQVAAAIQRSEALAAAAAAVQKSAAASAASAAAAHAAGHFTSAPWTNAKPAYNHWG